MKRIHFRVTAIAAVALLCLVGCKKDAPPVVSAPPKPDTSAKYFPIAINTSNFYINYTYDDAFTVLSSVNKVQRNIDTMYSIAYNDRRQPLSLSSWSNGLAFSETQYTLNATGEVIRGDVYSVIPDDGGWGYYTLDTLKAYYILTYNTTNQLTQVTYHHANGQIDREEFFDYTSNGNISGVNSSVDVYLEYDNFNGIGKNVKYAHLFFIEGADQLLFHKKNNPVKLNGTSRSYKYNYNQYPIEMTIKNGDGPQIFKIAYDLKY